MPFDGRLTTSLTGAWVIHFVLIVGLKIFYDIIPNTSQETSWTLTNISYMLGSYIMFHWVRGVPFEFNGGAYDNLNMWEQIDNGDQYTPTKKFLLAVPVVLFLISTHYTHYDLTYFMINFLATLAVVVPKLPAVGSYGPMPLRARALANVLVAAPPTPRNLLRKSNGHMTSSHRTSAYPTNFVFSSASSLYAPARADRCAAPLLPPFIDTNLYADTVRLRRAAPRPSGTLGRVSGVGEPHSFNHRLFHRMSLVPISL